MDPKERKVNQHILMMNSWRKVNLEKPAQLVQWAGLGHLGYRALWDPPVLMGRQDLL